MKIQFSHENSIPAVIKVRVDKKSCFDKIWSGHRQAPGYAEVSKRCHFCVREKLAKILAESTALNKRSENCVQMSP